MIPRISLVDYLKELLHPEQFSDYCPNGLQVVGKAQVSTIVTGVSACQSLLNAACQHNADLVLVHHGYFWKGEDPCITGVKYNRLKTLIENDINLIAYHLPLDAHPEFGNNVQLARVLNFIPEGQVSSGETPALTWYGKLENSMTGHGVAEHIKRHLGRKPLYIEGQSERIERVAWCTGAAQDFIDIAIAHGVDAFITGEVSERTVHTARESGMHFYAAGHHATERYGIKALGEHLAAKFDVDCRFIDIDNPV